MKNIECGGRAKLIYGAPSADFIDILASMKTDPFNHKEDKGENNA